MKLASRSLCRAGLLVTLAAAIFTFGCAKKQVAAPAAAAAAASRGCNSHGDLAG